jgi:hypothetical protein
MTESHSEAAQLDAATRQLDALALGASPEDADRTMREMIAATDTGENAARINAMVAEITARRNALGEAQNFKPAPGDFETPPAVSDKEWERMASAILALPTAAEQAAKGENPAS